MKIILSTLVVALLFSFSVAHALSVYAAVVVDVASVDRTDCKAADGVSKSDKCEPASTYNCATGALCSYAAWLFSEDLQKYTNNYVGHVPGVGPAAACDKTAWAEIWNSPPYQVFPRYLLGNYPRCK